MTKKKNKKKNSTPKAMLLGPELSAFTAGSNTAAAIGPITAALAAQHRLQFVVRWATQKSLVLMSLQIKTAPTNLWQEILTHPVTDKDGTIVVEMGMYSAGDSTIRFIIGALGAIPKAVTFVAEDEQKVTAFKPTTGSKKLDQGEVWRESAGYKIGVAP